MMFNVLFIDDEAAPRADIENAASRFNSTARSTTRLYVRTIPSPQGIREELNHDLDLVLADVNFRVPHTGKHVNQLKTIIDTVRTWESEEGRERAIPIIAYTSWGLEELKACLAFRDDLYDIWDKYTASPDYVAWRLSSIAIELSAGRPDRTVQRYIQAMNSNCAWHAQVVEMTHEYDAGWNERDQIVRSGRAIRDIAESLGSHRACIPLWEVMHDWEFLGRAADESVRGHARHVINVFWLGYCLLNGPSLSDFWKRSWKQLTGERALMSAVQDATDVDAWNAVWFYAALFHDVGCGVEHFDRVIKKLKTIVAVAPACLDVELTAATQLTDRFQSEVESLRVELQEPWRTLFKGAENTTHLDQGLVSALSLRTRIIGKQAPFGREAARAAAIHNAISRVVRQHEGYALSWEKEPFGCLLVLCDQLQTWDRERADETLTDQDWPHRAELRALSVATAGDGRPRIRMAIDYLAPRHVFRSPIALKRLRQGLTEILREKPQPVLECLADWPFALEVTCSMNGETLPKPMTFGV